MLYAQEYYINDSIWNYFNPIKQKMPKSVSARNIFYSKRKYEIIEEDNFIYLLLFREFKFKGQISPFSIEKEKIKSLILNKNKMDYLFKVENELIQNGKLNNDLKILNENNLIKYFIIYIVFSHAQSIDKIQAIIGEILLISDIENQYNQILGQGVIETENMRCQIVDELLLQNFLIHHAKIDN